MLKYALRFRIIPAFIVLMTVCAGGLYGQTKSKIELLGAKDLKYDKRFGADAQRLIGDVRFRHQGALMFCDSAYLYDASNTLDAFGNVKINQGDTLFLYGDKLNYNGETRMVKVRNNVRLEDGEMTLTTHILDYNRRTEVAVFYDRGTIVSTKNDNVLIACEGDYIAHNEFFHFRDSVVLINPGYTVETDTLDYDNRTEIAYFEGPTFIFSDENTIYCENGWYDTRSDISQFNENAYLDNQKQVLRGDSLWYSRNEGLGRAFKDVSITDTTDHYIISGQRGNYYENEKRTVVTVEAQLIQYDERDSLFLHADTLQAVDDFERGNLLFAHRNARFFRKDMQGAADSMYFAQRDSTIYMYFDPVLWSDDLQITGDTMEIINTAEGLDRLLVYRDAMLIDFVEPERYNQIKGRTLTGYFRKNELYYVFIQGNGQSLYFAMEEVRAPEGASGLAADTAATSPASTLAESTENRDAAAKEIETDTAAIPIDTLTGEIPDTLAVFNGDSIPPDSAAAKPKKPRTVQRVMGVNKAECSNIAIYLEDKRVQRIRFLVSPDGKFIPIDLFDKDNAYLGGFTWQHYRRPLNRADIFRKAPLIKEEEDPKKKGKGKKI